MGQEAGLFYSPTPSITKKAGHLVGLYHICIYCTYLSFLTSSTYLQKHFCLCDERRNGTGCFFTFVVQQNTAEYISIHQHFDHKQECRKTKRFELYQYYKFGTSDCRQTYTCMAICLNENQMQTYTGDIPSTKEAPTPPTLQILSSIPLPRPYLYQPILSPTISIISQKIAITFIF